MSAHEMERALARLYTDSGFRHAFLCDPDAALSALDLTAAEKEIAAEVEELKSSIGKTRKAREKIAENVDANLLARYQMIFSRRAGVAVALAKGGTCQGCRMRLPPQLYNEIQKHLQIHFCPNCQRVLYYEEPAEKPTP